MRNKRFVLVDETQEQEDKAAVAEQSSAVKEENLRIQMEKTYQDSIAHFLVYSDADMHLAASTDIYNVAMADYERSVDAYMAVADYPANADPTDEQKRLIKAASARCDQASNKRSTSTKQLFTADRRMRIAKQRMITADRKFDHIKAQWECATKKQ